MSTVMKRTTVGSLLLAAAAIIVHILAGADYPAVPPGVIVFLAVAGLVMWRPRRWSAGVALAVGLFIGVGGIVAPNTSDNLGSSSGLLVAATIVQLATLVGVIVASALALLFPGRPGERRR